MLWQIDQFRETASEEGLRSAVADTYEYLTPHDFIRERLLVVGPATLPHAAYVKLYGAVLDRRLGRGVDVMDKDWDNLIILDAYNAGYFERHSSLEGDLSTVTSKGNWSGEFIIGNFADETFHDTVVVTANPHYQKGSKTDESTFHKLINPSGVDDRTESYPEQVTASAVDAAKTYPNKRLIVHYMQPHPPHMGPTSDAFREAFSDESFRGHLMFRLYEAGLISRATLRQSYVDTIAVVEDEVKRLTAELSGKTVVSADHGENLGEVQHWMVQLKHGNPTPECRRVPWLEMDYSERKEIVADDPVGYETIDDDAVEERLVALGYK